jgi:toxin ParE1/3/4
MAFRLERTDQACTDMRDIWLYIAPDNITAADKLVDDFKSHFELLQDQPYLGRAIDDSLKGYRYLVCRAYVMVYAIDQTHQILRLVRVLHGAQQWQEMIGT